MKALVQTGVERLEMRDVARPEAGAGEALVRIEASGICGSDMHAFLGHDARRPTPIVLGHEASGTIEGGARDGERVTINPLVACGACEHCGRGHENLCPDRQIISMPPRPGAFATHVVMPERNLVAVPDHVSAAEAALAEPIACGWHAVRLARRILDRPLAGLACTVIGGGPIGVGAALALRAQGADDVTVLEPNPLRRESLVAIEGFRTADTDAPNASATLVVDAVGFAATRAAACRIARPGGVIAHIGLGEAGDGLDARRMTLHEIAFLGTYTYTAEDFRETARAMFDGRLGPLDWTEQRPLAEGARAFADIRAGRVAQPKVILEPET